MKAADITELEQTLGYRFRRPDLIQQALTHSSQARELESLQTPELATRFGDNEQLEFLGDAVLGLVTSQELFQRFPGFREGELSKLRAHLVSEKHLIRVARQLDVGRYLHLGRGEEKSGGRNKPAILVDALEAVLAAMYLDGGLEITRNFILQRIVGPELSQMALEPGSVLPITDFKSALQERLQAKGCPQPSYVLVREEGPEHNKTFTVEVRLRLPGSSNGEIVGRATGSTKKKAEQDAARQALEHMASEPDKPHLASKGSNTRVER
jgi:ribonuclease-3